MTTSTPNQSHFNIPGFESQAPDNITPEAINPHLVTVVNTEKPLASYNGFDVSAEIKLCDDSFLILDFRESPEDRGYIYPFGSNGPALDNDVEFLIISQEFQPTIEGMQYQRGYKAIRKGEPIRLGRAHYADRFNYSPTTSNDHARILYDEAGNLTLRDTNSSNGTHIIAPEIVQISKEQYRGIRNGAEQLHGTQKYDKARIAQQEAVKRIREQEAADLRARQEAKQRENAARLAARLIDEEQVRQQWLAEVKKREDEINQLEEPVRTVFEKRDEEGHLRVKIPRDLSINDAAHLIRDIMKLRNAKKSDAVIYKRLSMGLHPDIPRSSEDKAHGELKFRLLGEVYDSSKNKFKF